MNPTAIARTLTTQGILTPRGKKTWTATTVRSILTNEKYKGDALLQKPSPQTFSPRKQKPTKAKSPNTT
ncbi:recombinase family protein [Arcanobacterium hippocoleae]|uniref:recombinase family protein n=1 Tax=Arcanobacterium hippocoleae TaxID=149017 RepID=UPI00333FA302